MAFLHSASGEIHCKVVYCGPGFGGKTTNLEFLNSRLPQERRGRLISLKTAEARTLFFDLLPIHLGAIRGFTTRVHLYTVPGQPQYASGRRVVLRGADGLVFVADSDPERFDANRASLAELTRDLALERRALTDLPLVFQYNKRDLPAAVPVAYLERGLNTGRRPAFPAVAIRGEGVLPTLQAILADVILAVTAGPAGVVS
jgi:signal recognition particle receptor subunit beta